MLIAHMCSSTARVVEPGSGSANRWRRRGCLCTRVVVVVPCGCRCLAGGAPERHLMLHMSLLFLLLLLLESNASCSSGFLSAHSRMRIHTRISFEFISFNRNAHTHILRSGSCIYYLAWRIHVYFPLVFCLTPCCRCFCCHYYHSPYVIDD